MGTLVACLSLLPRYYQGIAACTGANLAFMKQMGQYEELFKYMELPVLTQGTEKPEEFLNQGLDLVDIHFAYGDAPPVLEDYTLHIEPGKWLGMEGESGRGKSTLMHLILQLYQPSAGTILLDGRDITALDILWYRSHIAYVDQTPFLFNASIYDNFKTVGAHADEAAMWRALKLACLDQKIRDLPDGLHAQVGENGVAFSGGEKQRLALAIALYTERPLLVLDEATSNIDEDLDGRIMQHLRALVDEGLTILSVSHRKSFHRLCDRVIRL